MASSAWRGSGHIGTWRFFVILFLFALVLSSCKGIEITGKTESIPGYSKAEAMVVIASERNRYQSLLGTEIWSVPLKGQRESLYGPYFVARMKEFLQDIKTLNLMAKEKGMPLTTEEQERIRAAAAAFYEGLSEEDRALMDWCTQKDVTTVYEEYYIAQRTAETILDDVEFEVSDSDAKVITVQQIVLSDRGTAEQLYQDVTKEGANFAYFARQSSEEQVTELQLSRFEQDNEFYRQAFSLEKNGISSVFEMDGKYYILKCLNDYDEGATEERKEKLERSIRSNAFLSEFHAFRDEHIVRFREAFWNEIDLSEHPESTASNFFDIYEEYLGDAS